MAKKHGTALGPAEPADYLLAIFEDERRAEWVASELLDSGFAEDDLLTFFGHAGAQSLDSPAGDQSLLGRCRRVLQGWIAEYGELDQLPAYGEEVAQGACVLAVRIANPHRQAAATRVYRRHDGRRVRTFGHKTVESRAPTTA